MSYKTAGATGEEIAHTLGLSGKAATAVAAVFANAAILVGKKRSSAVKTESPKSNINQISPYSLSSALGLKTKLSLEQGNILKADGTLTSDAIKHAKNIELKDPQLGNPSVVNVLTKDGSDISDWVKMKTDKVMGPNGKKIEVHFYQNTETKKIDYETLDYKVKGVIPGLPKAQPIPEPTVSPAGE